MSKNILGIILLLTGSIWSIDVPIEEVEKKVFTETIKVNSKIVQLQSAKENVMARIGGKVIKYFVKQGQIVKKGQAVATISSLELSSLVTELKSLKKQLVIVNKNYNIIKKLYNTGVESQQNLNRQEEERTALLSKIEAIKNRLSIVDAKGKNYTLYAGGSGKVDKILVPTNSVVDANKPLLSIIKGSKSFLVKSYIPLRYLNDITVGQKGKLIYGGKSYKMHISQILPKLDEETQQMVVLSSLDESVNNLFVNAYVDSKLSIGTPKSYLAIKKSALSFFNNEWVVFVPERHEEEEHHEEKEHDEHGHDGHEEVEEVPYDICVVKIIQQDEKWVAIEGLDEHEDYVSDKSYYIKSMLLKSSLGGHGH